MKLRDVITILGIFAGLSYTTVKFTPDKEILRDRNNVSIENILLLLEKEIGKAEPLTVTDTLQEDSLDANSNYPYKVDDRIIKMVQDHPELAPYVNIVYEETLERIGYFSDLDNFVMLILGMIYQESRGKANAISPAGAVGVAQFMPQTAKLYGLETKADNLFDKYRKKSREARKYLRLAEKYERLGNSKRALTYFRRYVDAKDKAKNIFKKYKKVIEELRDERLDALKSVGAMVEHVLELLEIYNGNVLYAISAYNAGVGAVNKYKGIPPFGETTYYVSKILEVLGRYGFNALRINTRRDSPLVVIQDGEKNKCEETRGLAPLQRVVKDTSHYN